MSRMKKLTEAERAKRDEKRERRAARRSAVEIRPHASSGSVARPKRIPTVGTCAYCVAENVALTTEHVFPESWYPDEHFPSKMLTVPACGPCNAAYDQVEKRLFLPLAVSLPKRPAYSIDRRACTSFGRAARGEESARQQIPPSTRRVLSATYIHRDARRARERDVDSYGPAAHGLRYRKWVARARDNIALVMSVNAYRDLAPRIATAIREPEAIGHACSMVRANASRSPRTERPVQVANFARGPAGPRRAWSL